MKLRGRKAILDDIYLEPGSRYFRSIQVKLKNKEVKNYVGKYGGNDAMNIKIKGLAGKKLSKVSFLVREIEKEKWKIKGEVHGLQYYEGIRIYDWEGNLIEEGRGTICTQPE